MRVGLRKTQNLEDLRKISDYSHILVGVKLTIESTTQGIEKPTIKGLNDEIMRMYQDAISKAEKPVYKWKHL